MRLPIRKNAGGGFKRYCGNYGVCEAKISKASVCNYNGNNGITKSNLRTWKTEKITSTSKKTA